jgi:hypothetical protein
LIQRRRNLTAMLLDLPQRLVAIKMLAAGDEPDFALAKVDGWHAIEPAKCSVKRSAETIDSCAANELCLAPSQRRGKRHTPSPLASG